MIRPSRLILGAALVIAGACSADTPTAPERAQNTMAPEAGPLMTESDTTCRGGFTVPNGKTC